MKRILLTLIAIAMTTFAMGQKSAQVIKSDLHHLKVEYRTGEVSTTTTEYDGNLYSIMVIDGYGYSNEIGAPMMPMNTSIIEIPICGEIESSSPLVLTISKKIKFVLTWEFLMTSKFYA